MDIGKDKEKSVLRPFLFWSGMPLAPLEDEPEKKGGAQEFTFSERPNISICLNQSYEAVYKDPVQLW